MSVAILLSARRRPRPAGAATANAAAYRRLAGASWLRRPLDRPQTVLQALLEYDPRNFEQRIIVDLRLGAAGGGAADRRGARRRRAAAADGDP